MSRHPIIKITLFLVVIVESIVFAVEVWGSINNLGEGGPIFLSFIAMFVAIASLFMAYICLNDSLEESLKVSQ